MSALAIRRRLRCRRNDLALIIALVALTGAIASHHSGLAIALHHDGSMSAAAELCLAVFTAVGAAIVAAALAVGAMLSARRGPAALAACAVRGRHEVVARARHGPVAVRVLCVDRR